MGNSSVNSTPASDTFYTATSVLSPDPRDLISPLSPLPLDAPPLECVKEKKEQNQGGHGAFVNEKSDYVLEVPKDNYVRGDLSLARGEEPLPSAVKSLKCEGEELPSKNIKTDAEEIPRTPDCTSAIAKDKLAAFLTSPILQVEGERIPHGSPIAGAATSTPIKVSGSQGLKKGAIDILSPAEADDKKETLTSYSYKASGNESSYEVYSAPSDSYSSDQNVPQACVDNNNRQLDNNNKGCANGNFENQGQVDINQKSTDTEGSSGTQDKAIVNKEYEKSTVWHSGIEDVCESSALISPEAEVAKASEVLLRLREGSEKQDTSVSEQVSAVFAKIYFFIIIQLTILSIGVVNRGLAGIVDFPFLCDHLY